MRVLNLGCGSTPLKNTKDIEYTNVDILKIEGVIKHNLTKIPYPFESKEFDKIFFFHTIEHIPEDKHPLILCEIRRILKEDGEVAISYPEFPKVAANYLKNKNNDRDYWKACIYGRGRTEWDRHKALMDTPFFIEVVRQCGLNPIKIYSEKNVAHHTVMILNKCVPTLNLENLALERL